MATARRCGCCWPAGVAPSAPAWQPPASPRALIVGAPQELRAELRGHPTGGQVRYCAKLRCGRLAALSTRPPCAAYVPPRERIQALNAEAAGLKADLAALVAAAAPWLGRSTAWADQRGAAAGELVAPGTVPLRGRVGGAGRHQPDPCLVGPGGPPSPSPWRRPAAQLRPAHPGAGAVTRPPQTKAYLARRTAEGKSLRDVKRCLKRHIARQLFRLLERYDQPGVEILRAARQHIAASSWYQGGTRVLLKEGAAGSPTVARCWGTSG